jgi:hypothetical protein
MLDLCVFEYPINVSLGRRTRGDQLERQFRQTTFPRSRFFVGLRRGCVPRQEFVEASDRVHSNEGVTCSFEGDFFIDLVHRIRGVQRERLIGDLQLCAERWVIIE